MKNQLSYFNKLEIGANYITDDGKTRIYIHLEEGRTSPKIGLCPNGTVTIDWGDGTDTDSLTGTSITTVKWSPTHQYATSGNYVITLTVNGSMSFYGAGSANQYSGILRHAGGADVRNHAYRNAVKKIEIGSGVTKLPNYAFAYCYSLSYITIPSNITDIGTHVFYYCYSLRSVVFPNGMTTIGNSMFSYCYALSSVSIPKATTITGTNAFAYCNNLNNITIPEGTTTLPGSLFYYCYSLASVNIPSTVTVLNNNVFYCCFPLSVAMVIPKNVTTINGKAFYYAYSLNKIRFEPTTPPTLTASDVFNGLPEDCIISVPTGTLSAYTSATNYPSADTYTYIEED
jgi:hypothetical protein